MSRDAGLLAAAALAAAAYLVGLVFGLPGPWVLVKPVPALCLGAAVFARPGPLARWLGVGLVLSAVGDVALDLGTFVGGLGAFLLAHLAYAVGFSSEGAPLRPARALPFLLWAGGTYAHLWSGFGSLWLPVGLYVLAITAMMWRAAARVPGPGAALGLAGAISFAASDSLIAFDRFHAPIGGRLAIMVLYWLGQLGIAGSVLRR